MVDRRYRSSGANLRVHVYVCVYYGGSLTIEILIRTDQFETVSVFLATMTDTEKVH
jgi:hypothetical protein